MTGRILVTARDAGAGAALAPVVRALIEAGTVAPAVIGYGRAADAFAVAGLPQLAFAEDPTHERVAALLRRERVAVVLTGTSLRVERDAAFWKGAAAAGLPSVALLDHWVMYAERFTLAAPFDVLPDVVAVMDETAAQELERAGCPPERIVVTGHPGLDPAGSPDPATEREHARHELGADDSRPLVVFASEPQADHYGRDALGYVEDDAAGLVARAVAEVAPGALLIFKPHPLERTETLEEIAADARVETRVVRSYPSRLLIAAADVVCGMTSVFLLEAALAGRPALSIRPGGGDWHFLDVHRNLIASITDPGAVPDALVAALRSSPAPPETPGFALHAIERVLDLLQQLAASASLVSG